jgi:hypothetical protein
VYIWAKRPKIRIFEFMQAPLAQLHGETRSVFEGGRSFTISVELCIIKECYREAIIGLTRIK